MPYKTLNNNFFFRFLECNDEIIGIYGIEDARIPLKEQDSEVLPREQNLDLLL